MESEMGLNKRKVERQGKANAGGAKKLREQCLETQDPVTQCSKKELDG